MKKERRPFVFFFYLLNLKVISGMKNMTALLLSFLSIVFTAEECDESNYREYISDRLKTNDLIRKTQTGCQLKEVNLQEISLRKAFFKRANLSRANLMQTDMKEAYLAGADLSGADLTQANLKWANLQDANLKGADLTDANLRWVDLTRTDLQGAVLTGADFYGSIRSGTVFSISSF